MSSQPDRPPYKGTAKKLLVAIDIGTTFSALSFSILQPGETPTFNEIQRWPKQATPDAKVPSVVFYDEQGAARAFGAETEDDEILYTAEAEGWRKAEWWKLHLRPGHLPIISDLTLPALPPSVTVDQIFSHYLSYIKDRLKEFITTQYGEGAAIWNALSPSMEIVLTTPNGWEIGQQQRMRAAAQSSGLAAGKQGAKRVSFVSEAEAAVLYAIESGCIGEWLQTNGEMVLCDCGGGTIDVASYRITGLVPLRLEETTAAGCYLAGAVYVTEACQVYLKDHLRGTEWGSNEAIERAVHHFERNAKRKFESVESPSWIELGGFKNMPNLGIVRGKLKIPGATVASFFERSLKHIKEGLERALQASDYQAKKVILVGGLAGSPYVYRELQEWGVQMGISVSRPDGPTTKAVANGALAWYLDKSVAVRVNKYHYGTLVNLPWSSFDPEMVGRPRYIDAAGQTRVSGAWSSIVTKDVRIENRHEYTQPFTYKMDIGENNFQRKCDIWVYRWDQPSRFITLSDGQKPYPGFELLCTVEANLRAPFKTATIQGDTKAKRYKVVEFNICLAFGDTELTTRLSWLDHGQLRYGKATIAQRNLTPEASA